jgi:PAS domain S-box-containing protein
MPVDEKPKFDRLALRLFAAISITLAAFLWRQMLAYYLGPIVPPFFTVYPAVMIVALLCGFWYGLLSIFFSAGLVVYWIYLPLHQTHSPILAQAVTLVTFIGLGCFMSLVGDRVRSYQQQIEALKTKQLLHEKETHYRSILDNCQDVIYCLNLQTKVFEYVSPTAVKVLGFPAEEFKAHRYDELLELFHPDDRLRIKAAMEHLDKTGETLLEYRQLTSDGEYYWLSNHLSLIRDANGKPLYRTGNIRNITEHKQAEAEKKKLLDTVKEERDRLSALINSIDDEVWFIDAKNQKNMVNPAALRTFHLDSADGVDFEKLARDFEVYRPDFSVRPFEEAPPYRALLGESVKEQEEIMRVPITGELRHRMLSSTPIRDANGNIIGAATVARDITRQKQAERELRISQNRLEAIIGSAMDAIITIDANQRILVFNAAAEKIFACPAEQALNQTLDHFLPLRFRKRHQGNIHDFDRSGVPSRSIHFERQNTGLRATGEEFPFEATISQFVVNDEKLYTIILRDITERKLTEIRLRRSQDQLRALTSRLETAAERERLWIARELHDQLGPILTGMKMDLAWILRKHSVGEEEMRPVVESTIESIDSTIALVRRLATELRPEMLDAIGLPAAIQWHMEKFQHRTGILCTINVPDILLGLSSDHEIAVFRIFQEAMTNIARHSKARNVYVQLSLEENYANLTIRDDGVGFLLDSMEHSHSLGILGMNERALLVDAHFSLQSEPGKGTTIGLQIPLAKAVGTKRGDCEDINRR